MNTTPDPTRTPPPPNPTPAPQPTGFWAHVRALLTRVWEAFIEVLSK